MGVTAQQAYTFDGTHYRPGDTIPDQVAKEHGLLEDDESDSEETQQEPPQQGSPEEVDATDAAAALAEEYGLELSEIEGSGEEGRVLKSDVEAAIEAAFAEDE